MPARLLARIGALGALLLTLTAGSAPAEEAAFASAAARGAHSSARLLAGGEQGGIYRAGVEIALDPETVTYWRQPGDAGSPPVFDFSGSENLAEAETLYPAPKHIVEAGIEVAGYDRDVIFPLRIKPKDAAKPVLLKLSLDYAACKSICVPAKAKLTLALPKPGASSPYAAVLAAADALVPRRLAAAEARNAVTVARTGEGAWRLRYVGPGRATDVFIEAAEPHWIDSRRSDVDNAFDLQLASTSTASERTASISARATILTDGGAIEAPLQLK
jgi:DsbC/DsbD-like thiol-disulfide interchange protein